MVEVEETAKHMVYVILDFKGEELVKSRFVKRYDRTTYVGAEQLIVESEPATSDGFISPEEGSESR